MCRYLLASMFYMRTIIIVASMVKCVCWIFRLRATNPSTARLKQLAMYCQLTKAFRTSWLQAVLIQGLRSQFEKTHSHFPGPLRSVGFIPSNYGTSWWPGGSETGYRPLGTKSSLSKLLLTPYPGQCLVTCDWVCWWSGPRDTPYSDEGNTELVTRRPKGQLVCLPRVV